MWGLRARRFLVQLAKSARQLLNSTRNRQRENPDVVRRIQASCFCGAGRALAMHEMVALMWWWSYFLSLSGERGELRELPQYFGF
jgi:hypothetical protein